MSTSKSLNLTDLQQSFRPGFTLVEMLVVMVILATMGGMVVAAVQGVSTTIRESRTKSIIASIDSVIQEQYEAYKYRPLPVEIPDFSADIGTGTSGGTVQSLEILANEAARVRLLMVRDLQRMELPERYTDISTDPSTIRAAATRVIEDSGTGEIRRQDVVADRRRTFRVSWYGYTGGVTSSNDLPSKMAAYRDRLPGTETTEFQSAECLYLIMSNAFVAGTPAISMIPSANIADTDEDGVPEILDGWGNPLGFVRWPVGFDDPNELLDTTKPDDFDLFRSDFAYANGTNTTPSSAAVVGAIDVNKHTSPFVNLKPWSLRPLIVSAGDDGEPGIEIDPVGTGGGPNFTYASTTWNWPVDTANMGDEEPGRTSPYPMVDPYLRVFISDNDPTVFDRSMTNRRLPGEFISATDTSDAADNITNYDLQAAQ